MSIFNRQPPNIRSHADIDSFRNTLKIDYYPSLNRWQSRQIFNRDGKVYQQLVPEGVTSTPLTLAQSGFWSIR